MREDLRVWWQLLAPGGLLLGDDFVRGWAGVVRAACEFAVEQGVELHSGDEFEDGNRVHRRSWQTKWWIFKPRSGNGRAKPDGAFLKGYLQACRDSAVHGGMQPGKRPQWPRGSVLG